MDPQLDQAGSLQGQRLSLGIDRERSVRRLLLPPESFAAGPFGGLLLVGSDDGVTSTVQAVDVAAGCSWRLATEDAVIRRATIDPVGRTLFEYRVDRSTRADLGVWARDLDGSTAHQVLEPLASDDRFGRTFTTEFSWSVDGSALAVQSCGEQACRTRFIAPHGHPARDVSEPDLGTMIGTDGDRLVSYLSCSGFPCPIVAIDLMSHARRTLADLAGIATLATTPDGARVIHEVYSDAGLSLRSIATDGSARTDLGSLTGGLRLQPSPNRADAATRLPAGWALLATDGRIAVDGPADGSQLRHVPDGASVQLSEVVP